MTNKKILNFIPNFSFGGVETTNINLSETLIKFGYEVELLTNDYQIVNESEYLNNVKSFVHRVISLLSLAIKPSNVVAHIKITLKFCFLLWLLIVGWCQYWIG